MEIDVVLIKSGHLFNADNRAEANAAARVLSRGDRGPAVVFVNGEPAEEYREGRKYTPGDYVHSRKARKATGDYVDLRANRKPSGDFKARKAPGKPAAKKLKKAA